MSNVNHERSESTSSSSQLMNEMDRLSTGVLPLPPPRSRPFSHVVKGWLNIRVIEPAARVVAVGACGCDISSYPKNEVNNRRYSLLSFLPLALFNQFKLFFNIFFLLTAVSQFVPALRVGFIFIYFGPLAFVVSLSLIKDGIDDVQRYRRDTKANAELYQKLLPDGETTSIQSKDIVVGDLIVLHAKQRIPADCVLLHTTEKSGASFVRTDQLDGETDWKLRFPIKTTQNLTYPELGVVRLNIQCEALHRDIYKFIGAVECSGNGACQRSPAGCRTVLWLRVLSSVP